MTQLGPLALARQMQERAAEAAEKRRIEAMGNAVNMDAANAKIKDLFEEMGPAYTDEKARQAVKASLGMDLSIPTIQSSRREMKLALPRGRRAGVSPAKKKGPASVKAGWKTRAAAKPKRTEKREKPFAEKKPAGPPPAEEITLSSLRGDLLAVAQKLQIFERQQAEKVKRLIASLG